MQRLSLALAVLVGASSPAAAQENPTPVFVAGTFFGGIERRPHDDTRAPVAFSLDLSGTTTGGAVGVGTFLSPRWSVRLELAVPSTLDGTFSPPAPPGIPSPVLTERIQLEYRTRTGAVLLGYHTSRRHRVSVEYLGGIAFVEQRGRVVTESVVRLPIPVDRLPRSELTHTSYGAAPVVGADVLVAITSHFGVVPQVRAHAFAGGLSIRPGVGVRWSF